MSRWTLKIESPEGVRSAFEIDETLVDHSALGEDKFLKEEFSRMLFQFQKDRAKLLKEKTI